jgi:ABC-type lipoprotein release transport system permease subunit
VAALIFMEACGLALVASAIGVGIGLSTTMWFSVYGIDYVGIEYSGITFQELIYPVLRMQQVTLFPMAVICFALIAAIYPAVYAARLRPAEALRRHD